jgi:hypothetical protein
MLLTFRHCIILDAESQQTNQPQHEFMASLKELLGLQPVLLLIYTHIISTLTVTAAHNIPVLPAASSDYFFLFFYAKLKLVIHNTIEKQEHGDLKRLFFSR